MSVKTYSPAQVQVNVGGFPIRGYADGTFVRAERREDTFALVVGADGEAARAQSANTSGSVTITLLQTAVSNDALSALQVADENTGSGVVTLLVKDAKGRTLVLSNDAWVKKPANTEYGKEVGTREWVIECAHMQAFVGGN